MMVLNRRDVRTEQVIAQATELEEKLRAMAAELASFVDTFAHEVAGDLRGERPSGDRQSGL